MNSNWIYFSKKFILLANGNVLDTSFQKIRAPKFACINKIKFTNYYLPINQLNAI